MDFLPVRFSGIALDNISQSITLVKEIKVEFGSAHMPSPVHTAARQFLSNEIAR
jgi:hypothetical protein